MLNLFSTLHGLFIYLTWELHEVGIIVGIVPSHTGSWGLVVSPTGEQVGHSGGLQAEIQIVETRAHF